MLIEYKLGSFEAKLGAKITSVTSGHNVTCFDCEVMISPLFRWPNSLCHYSCEHGIYVDDCLDLHMSNLDLDYCLKSGVTIVNVDATHTLTDSWIAVDAAGTAQFMGVNY